MPAGIRFALSPCLMLMFLTGCAARTHLSADLAPPHESADRADSADQVIFYVDGAGGGGPITDGTPYVRQGFTLAGFRGEFRPFAWQTGFGALADEVASVSYKRRAGERLAAEILTAIEAGRSQISVVATSAGTAVAIYALEALPDGAGVDSVALLSSAVSAEYDLVEALRRVERRLIVFRNERDSLLRSLIPLVGSADRKDVGDRVAGIYGFVLPEDTDEARRAAYRKVEFIDWETDLRDVDHSGGHTDCKNPRFISRVIAPRLFQQPGTMLASR